MLYFNFRVIRTEIEVI